MGLFDAFRKPPDHQHPFLGTLRHARGRWRGLIELEPGMPIALFVPGSRTAPDPDALRIAERAAVSWAEARPQVEAQLFEHYTAARDAEMDGIPVVSHPGDVWDHVTVSSAQVQPMPGIDLQVAMRVAWDEEHTLGAMIRSGRLEALNGSILEPR